MFNKQLNVKCHFLTIGLIVVMISCGIASGTDYYIDSNDGNDAHRGLTSDQAWQTLERINSVTFLPGDKILLKSGCVFKGQLFPKGSGAEGQPIIIDKWGGRKRPVIDGGGSSDDGGFYGNEGKAGSAVYLLNQEYWEICNLEVINHGDQADYRRGVKVELTEMGQCHHIHIKNLYVHDINGLNKSKGTSHHELSKQTGGIFLCVTGDNPGSRFIDVLVDGCVVKNCDRSGISIGARRHWHKEWNTLANASIVDSQYHKNVVVRNNFIDDVGGDGIVVQYSKSPLIEYNVCKDAAKRSYKQGQYSAGIWPWMCEDALFQYNEVYNTHSTMDGQGFDCDSGRGTVYQYNYSHDNEGGFMLFCQGSSRDSIVRYNISQNDRFSLFTNSGGTAKVYNNTFYTGKGLNVDVNFSGATGSMQIYNNIFYNEGENRKPNWGPYDYDSNAYYGYETTPDDPRKIVTDPLLTDPGRAGTGLTTTPKTTCDELSKLNAYALKSGSPCIDKGRVFDPGYEVQQDLWKKKISDGQPDIGAFEYPKKKTGISAGRVPPVMKAVYTSVPVKVDGKLDDAVWEKAAVYQMTLPADREGELAGGGTVRLAWDNHYLYVAVNFEDSDIVAEGERDQLKHYEFGDLLELFLHPADQTWYWELYATPGGYKSSYWFPGRGRVGLPSGYDYDCGLKVAANCASGTLNDWRDRDTYWTAEMAMPVNDLKSFGDSFGVETDWRILIARYDYSRYNNSKGPEYSSSPTLSQTNFHLHEDYAILKLVR